MLIRSITLAALIVVLSSCSNQTVYQPAERRGAEGYTETKLTNNRYRVTFTGNSITPSETVKDYALMRAAELTLQEGYDWFYLADRNTDKKVHGATSIGAGIDIPSQTEVYQRCGLMRCNTVATTSPGFSTGGDISSTTTSSSYSSALEIVLGKYPMPNSVESYDARELASTLRSLMNKSK